QSAAKHVQMLAEAYETSGGNLKLGHELRKSIAQYASMFAVPVQQMRLGQAIKSIEGTSIQSRTFNEIMRNLEGVDPIALNRIWSIAQSDRHKLSLLKNLANPGVFKGSVMQVLVNSLISSPATAFWNTMSMGAMSLSRANELRILGKIDPVRNAPDNASLFLTSLYGFYGKIIAGDVAARKTMKTALKDANIYADTATAQGLRDKYSFNFRESIPGRAGKIINFPTQLTAYTDAIFGTAIKTAASEVAANNAVWMEKSASRLTMSEAQFQTELKLARASKLSDENATVMFQGKPTLIKDIADNEAAKITLMANPETEAGKYIEAMSKNSLLARMVIPFPRPFILSAEQALQHFPVVVKWMPTVSADLAAGGARGAAAQAKITNGTQMAGLFAMFAGAAYAFQNEDGTEKFGFTGSGPSVKEQRAMWAATNRPDTLYVGGKEISLAKLGYPGQVMAATANVMGFINDAANMGHTDIDVTDL
ncbi:MAG TPA: hypothetical protein VJ742_09635, partial [Nitrososphaera sp.]|nr:hypothetical protein [Nitrososphaera sp.]